MVAATFTYVPDRAAAWRHAGCAFAVSVLALGIANRETLWAWAQLWFLSGQEYGAIAWVIAGWLVWQSRGVVRRLSPRPDPRALALIAPLGVAWWLAYVADIRLAQFSLVVASLGALTWAVLGGAIARKLAYPIAFLFLALPIGNYVEPILQGMTVQATGMALRLTGLPVFIDQTYIHVPGRTIVVLSQCSGAQFFQVGLTIGALYAYLNFRRPALQTLAVIAFVAAAILGNWVRVYILCFTGPLPGRQHEVLGWCVFAVTLGATFFLCARLRRLEVNTRGSRVARRGWKSQGGLVTARAPARVSNFAWMATISTVLLTAGSVAANGFWGELPRPRSVELMPIRVAPPWLGPGPAPHAWRPLFRSADAQVGATYRWGTREVGGYWVYYSRQHQGAEVINELNTPYDPHDWVPRGGYAGTEYRRIVLDNGSTLPFIEMRLQHLKSGSQLVIWYWYSVAGRAVAKPLQAKVVEVVGKVTGRADATVVVIGTDGSDPSVARDVLADFVTSNAAALTKDVTRDLE